MSHPKIKKVVFPVGGLGTRFLPATKSMPKEMLPVVNKPLIHYAFEEARAAGAQEFIFVTGRNKHAIEDHFDHVHELQSHLSTKNKRRELELTSDWLPPPGSISFIRQQEPLGLGHAVWCARHAVGDEPFAVILADDMVLAGKPCLKQMVEAYDEVGGNILGVMEIPREKTGSYGIVDIDYSFSLPNRGRAGVGAQRGKRQTLRKNAPHLTSPLMGEGRLVRAKGLVEKPTPEKAPSTLSIIGRYILQPDVFDKLDKQKPGAGGEIQLTDAIGKLIPPLHPPRLRAGQRGGVYGYLFDGVRYDCGGLVGFVAANVAYALEREDICGQVAEELREVLKRGGIR